MTDEVTFRSHKILRWSFFCLNLLILLIGVVLISLSASSIAQRQEFAKESDKHRFLVENDNKLFLSMIVIAIAISVLLIFLSLFGLCGAFGDKKCLISFYLVFALLNLGLVIMGGMVVLRFSKKTEDSLKDHISNYHRNETSKYHVDNIRRKLNCCGIHAFYNLTYLQAEIETVTTSCCVHQHTKACNEILQGNKTAIEFEKWEEISQNIYTEGCLFEITKMSKPISEYILSFCVVIAIIDLAGLLLSVSLCCGV